MADIEQVLITKQAMSLYQSKKITIHEALMFSIITSLDNEKGCFATNRYLADNLPIEVDRVKEIIKSLVKKGYVKSTMTENNTRRVLTVINEDQEEQQAPEEQQEKVVSLEDHAQKVQKTAKQFTGYISQRAKEFSKMDNHDDWDFDEIERLENERTDILYKELKRNEARI